MQEQTKTLWSRMNGSDKVYVVRLLAQGDGFIVTFQNGPRSGTLTNPKPKTPSPVSYDAALAVMNKLVREKMNGSSKYVEDESVAIAYQCAPEKSATGGFLPQLLNPIREPDLERYLKDDNYVAAEKFNGERRPVRATNGAVLGINKKGDAVAVSVAIEGGVQALLVDRLLIDGEDLGDELVVFDALEIDGEDLRQMGYLARYRRVEELLRDKVPGMRAAGIAIGEAAKRALLAELIARKAEGMVFKHRDSAYEPGRPASGGPHIKFKLVEQCTCEVAAVNSTKRSIAVRVYGADGQPVDMGNVGVPESHPVPAVGAFVEIEYLYAVRSLVQPVYLGERRDQDRTDCTLAQIKFAPKDDRIAA